MQEEAGQTVPSTPSAAAKSGVASHFVAIVVGVLLAFIADTIIPRASRNSAASVAVVSSPVAVVVQQQQLQQQQQECDTGRGRRSSLAPPDNTLKANKKKIRAKVSSSSSASSDSWLCRDEPERCGVVYHAFVLDARKLRRMQQQQQQKSYDDYLRRYINNRSESSSLPTASSLLPIGLEFWRAVMSAASLKRAHSVAKVPQVGGVVLATNYPRALVEVAKRIYDKVSAVLCDGADDGGGGGVGSDDYYYASPDELFLDPLIVLLNSTALSLKYRQHHFSQRKQQKSTPSAPPPPDHIFRALACPPWPFDDVVFVLDKKVQKQSPPAAAAAAADAVGGTAPASPPRRDGDVDQYLLKADAIPLTSSVLPFERTVFLDSDTYVRRPVFSLLDSQSSLPFFNVAMVQEYHWMRDLSPYLYAPVLLSFSGGNDDGEDEDVNAMMMQQQQQQESRSWWVPHHTEGRKPLKRSPTPFGNNQALYELQYNTGVIAYRSKCPETMKFFKRWSRLHRSSARCRSDKVLWDQCSLPITIRRSTKVRVSTLPDTFNMREALGYGCSSEVYERDYRKNSQMLERAKEDWLDFGRAENLQRRLSKKNRSSIGVGAGAAGAGAAGSSDEADDGTTTTFRSVLSNDDETAQYDFTERGGGRRRRGSVSDPVFLERTGKMMYPSVDNVVVFHLFEAKKRQEEWMAQSAFWKMLPWKRS